MTPARSHPNQPSWLRFAEMRSVKKLIMLILLLLVALFLAGMGVMSSLNLRYSQDAMSGLRIRQLEDTFYANLDRIDVHHRLMEKNTEALARLGELFHRLREHGGSDRRGELAKALMAKIEEIPEASGGGIWFAPTVAGRQAAYAGWDERKVALNPAFDGARYDYTQETWYQAALAEGRDRPRTGGDKIHWSPVYYSPVLEDALVTAATVMRDETGRVIGVATTDWRADEIIRLVSDVDVTAGSFSFLIDRNDRKLSSLARAAESPAGQALMAALSSQTLAPLEVVPDPVADRELRPSLPGRKLDVGGRSYALYLARTRAGMLFGIGVPQDEIDAVLEPMRASNYRIAIATGVVLVVLSAIILYVVAGIMRLLETLYTDPLTGLANRAKLLRDTASPQDESLVVVNIDAFKEINDFYGQRCGDYVLNAVADELHAFLAGNKHGRSGILYKLHADEFAVLVPSRLSVDALNAFLHDLSTYMLARVLRWEGQEIGVTVTLGAAGAAYSLPKDGATGDALLSSASIALKLARLQHRDYSIYDAELRVREEYEQNLLWAKRLKAALQEDRIVPYFQPIRSNRSGEIERFECLVRMLDHQGQVVSPAQFLGVAKKLRLYREITRIMVEKSIAAFKDAPYDFSLNLSYQDLADPEITAFIKRRLRESGIGKRVIFEILESEGIDNYRCVKAFIDDVKALGCRIAIDDFGTGYSNFDHLLRLDADVIKLDGSLVRNLDSDPSAWIVTRGIVQFARELGLHTVAEFVHSDAVQEKVLALGIDYSQGARFGMPRAALMTEVVPSFSATA